MASVTYRFGDFRLDPVSRELRRGDEEVPLQRKQFDCLVYLIEHRHQAVDRETLFRAVWGDVCLSDNVLHQAISEVRRGLHDSGDEQRLIKTVRAFGYRWVAPVDVEAPPASAAADARPSDEVTWADTVGPPAAPAETVQAPAEAPAGFAHKPIWLGAATALLVVGALTGGTAYLSRNTDSVDTTSRAVLDGDDVGIALLLPVTVEEKGPHAWMRLGLMDLIAERLRAAGQPVVPSDTVIALLRDGPSSPSPRELDRLTETTGAHLVFEAHARRRGTRWWISVHSLVGAEPLLAALGEAEDPLDAAHDAADRLALSLGLAPALEQDATPGLTQLRQRVEAARLAQQYDEARALIEAAEPALRRHPEVRFLLAHLALARHDLVSAQATCESLLPATPAASRPRLRASILHCLAEVHESRADFGAAASALEEAIGLLQARPETAKLGRVYATRGRVALYQGDIDTAREYLAHARVALEGSGDADGLAGLDNYQGLLAAMRERQVEAVSHFERAAERSAALHRLGSELGNRANVLYLHVALLDLQAATRAEQRVHELVTEVANPEIIAWANLARAYLLASTGRSQKARHLLDEVLRGMGGDEDLRFWRLRALVLRAELAERNGDAAEAAQVATEVVEQVPTDYVLMAEERGRAGWIAVRSHLALGRRTAAAEATAVLIEWAEAGDALPPKIYAALAAAELAAAENRGKAAKAAFERALALADSGGVPLRLLLVGQSYVPWLLYEGPRGAPDAERALVVADRLAEYADRHYGAALLQLRVKHAIGSPMAWRTALTHARTLAGEREIPTELLVASRDDLHTVPPG